MIPSKIRTLITFLTVYPLLTIGLLIYTTVVGAWDGFKEGRRGWVRGTKIVTGEWKHMKWFRRSRRPRRPLDKRGFPL